MRAVCPLPVMHEDCIHLCHREQGVENEGVSEIDPTSTVHAIARKKDCGAGS
jgi:hypothetical protein